MDVPVELKGFGAVEPFASIVVKAQVAGTITEVLVKEGDHVKANQPLLRIDNRSFAAAVRQLDGTLARDEANAELSRYEAVKLDALLKKEAATPDEAYQAKSKADADGASVAATKALLEMARLEVEHCEICSPIDGVAGKLAINQGNVVKAYDVEILNVKQLQPVYVSFTLPQQHLPQIRQFLSQNKSLVVRADVPGESESETGTLSFIDNEVDAATGTIRLRGTFANADERLWPGQFVNVTLVLTMQKDRMIVPSRAVLTGQQGTFVFVIKPDETAEVRAVRTGLNLGAAVVVEGVSEGETVVTDGQLRLINAAKVKIVEAASRAAGGSGSAPASSGPASSAPATQPATLPAERPVQ